MKKFLWILLAVLCFTSCKVKEKIVEVEVPRITTEYVTKTDTFLQKDSVLVESFIKGDTVFKNKYVYKDKYKVIYKDSIKTDTVTQVKTVEKTVYQNKMNWVQTTLCYFGILSLFIILVLFTKKYIKI